MDQFVEDEVMLVKEVADFLNQHGEYAFALELYKTLIGQKKLSRGQRIALFQDGAVIALNAGDAVLGGQWRVFAQNLIEDTS